MSNGKNNGITPNTGGGCGCAIIILIVVIIVAIVRGCSGSHDKSEAFVFAQEYVKEELKAPATADFANILNSDVQEIGDNEFRISSYVDAQNSFGADLRSNYVIVVKYQDDSWKVESLNFK